MNIETFKRLAPVYFNAKLTPLIVGRHGIGKTEIQEQIAKDCGFDRVMNIKLGNLSDSADLLGLFEITETPDGKRTVYARPEFWPKSGEKVLIFFDEINRCKKELIVPVMEIALEYRHHDYKLPEGCRVIAAMNPATEDYDVEMFEDSAYISRFCQIELNPTPEEWGGYIKNRFGGSVNPLLVNFFVEKPNFLEMKMKPFTVTNTPDRRKITKLLTEVVPMKLDDTDLFNVASSMVGEQTAAAFVQHFKKVKDLDPETYVSVTAEGFLFGLDENTFNKMTGVISGWIQKKEVGNIANLNNEIIRLYSKSVSKKDKTQTLNSAAIKLAASRLSSYLSKLPEEAAVHFIQEAAKCQEDSVLFKISQHPEVIGAGLALITRKNTAGVTQVGVASA